MADKEVMELAEVIRGCPSKRGSSFECPKYKHPPTAIDCEECKAIQIFKHLNLKPSPVFKVIGDEEFMQYCQKQECDVKCFYDENSCNRKAQALADQSTHAGLMKEMIDAYDKLIEALPPDIYGASEEELKITDEAAEVVKALKSRYER